jgi:hypothetical protein
MKDQKMIATISIYAIAVTAIHLSAKQSTPSLG